MRADDKSCDWREKRNNICSIVCLYICKKKAFHEEEEDCLFENSCNSVKLCARLISYYGLCDKLLFKTADVG